MDEQIHAYLQENPSETYEPRLYSKISSEPIVTVKSQPLPNFGLNPDVTNLHVKLADFGSGTLKAAALKVDDITFLHSTPPDS